MVTRRFVELTCGFAVTQCLVREACVGTAWSHRSHTGPWDRTCRCSVRSRGSCLSLRVGASWRHKLRNDAESLMLPAAGQ